MIAVKAEPVFERRGPSSHPDKQSIPSANKATESNLPIPSPFPTPPTTHQETYTNPSPTRCCPPPRPKNFPMRDSGRRRGLLSCWFCCCSRPSWSWPLWSSTSPGTRTRSAVLAASSSTSKTPSPVRAEHSRYRTAPTLSRSSSPCSGVTSALPRRRCRRRSLFSPTRMVVVAAGQFRLTSDTHCCFSFQDNGQRDDTSGKGKGEGKGRGGEASKNLPARGVFLLRPSTRCSR